ncbi:MAG: LEA type 2 family protein [bacterium]
MRHKASRRAGMVLLLAAACAGLGPACATFLSGTAGAVLLDLAPVGLELFEFPAKLELKVSNPSKMTVSVSDIKYEVIIDGAVVASGEQQAPVTVEAEGSQVIAVPLSVKAGSVLTGIRSAVAKRGVKYQVRGSYSIAATSEQNFTAASLLRPLMKRAQAGGGEDGR